jgi:hypothetical protein
LGSAQAQAKGRQVVEWGKQSAQTWAMHWAMQKAPPSDLRLVSQSAMQWAWSTALQLELRLDPQLAAGLAQASERAWGQGSAGRWAQSREQQSA